jgi:hypothetical protein
VKAAIAKVLRILLTRRERLPVHLPPLPVMKMKHFEGVYLLTLFIFRVFLHIEGCSIFEYLPAYLKF